ncbi:MAG: tetratricopeptide repeat protein [Thermodesulfobacteriota bacterium]
MTEPSPVTFLLVHQDASVRHTEKTYLLDMGYTEILEAKDGTEAWYMIKNMEVGLVVSAWRLPDMSGLVLLKIIRADAACSDLPYLMVVEQVTKIEVIEAGEAGVTDIITKPLHREAFQAKVAQALKTEPDAKDTEVRKHYQRGVELMKGGRYEEALAEFKLILSMYESAEVYYNMGYIKTAQGKYEEAIAAFRRATQINSAFAQAYQKMGEVYALIGREDEAQACLQKAAEIYLEKQMEKEAEKALLEALKINPQTINVYNTLGIVYRRQARYQEAIRYYRKALKVTPDDENIHFNLARVYLSVKSVREARRALTTALSLNPDFLEAAALLNSLETDPA